MALATVKTIPSEDIRSHAWITLHVSLLLPDDGKLSDQLCYLSSIQSSSHFKSLRHFGKVNSLTCVVHTSRFVTTGLVLVACMCISHQNLQPMLVPISLSPDLPDMVLADFKPVRHVVLQQELQHSIHFSILCQPAKQQLTVHMTLLTSLGALL